MFIITQKLQKKYHSKKTYMYGCSCADSRDFPNNGFAASGKQYCRMACHKEALRWPLLFSSLPSPPHLRIHRAAHSEAAHTFPPGAAKLNPPCLLEEQRMVAPLTRRFHRHVPIRVECAKAFARPFYHVFREIIQGLVLLLPLFTIMLCRKVS